MNKLIRNCFYIIEKKKAAGNESEFADHVIATLEDRRLASQLGEQGRDEVIENWSLQTMVRGYQDLICEIYSSKVSRPGAAAIGETQATDPFEETPNKEPTESMASTSH